MNEFLFNTFPFCVNVVWLHIGLGWNVMYHVKIDLMRMMLSPLSAAYDVMWMCIYTNAYNSFYPIDPQYLQHTQDRPRNSMNDFHLLSHLYPYNRDQRPNQDHRLFSLAAIAACYCYYVPSRLLPRYLQEQSLHPSIPSHIYKFLPNFYNRMLKRHHQLTDQIQQFSSFRW